MRKGKGQLAEFEVFQSLQRAFYDQKCLLASGFKEEKLLSILKKEISLDKSERKKPEALDLTLSERVIKIFVFTIKGCW